MKKQPKSLLQQQITKKCAENENANTCLCIKIDQVGQCRTVSGCSPKKYPIVPKPEFFCIFQGGAKNLKVTSNYFMV